MKLIDILEEIDRDKLSTDIGLEWELSEEFDIYDIKHDFESQLKEFWIGPWYCTDTWVGFRVIFWNNKFLCLTYQSARKSSCEYKWVSETKRKEVYNYIASLKQDLYGDGNIELINFEEDFAEGYQVSYHSELLTMHGYNRAIYKGEEVKVLGKPPEPNDYICKKAIIIYKGFEKIVPLKSLIFKWASNK
jgi:hypothetical protein